MKYRKTGAEISACGRYRYSLERWWDDDRPPLVFICLNPSTANAEEDDPTVRRCVGFARSHQHGGVVLVNLFALRATNPREMARHFDPVGGGNDLTIRYWADSHRTVLAWGREWKEMVRRRSAAVRGMLSPPFWCLGRTKDGYPRHPLYLPGTATLKLYEEALKP